MDTPPKGGRKKLFKTIVSYFIQGVIILAPIALTASLLYWLFDKVDGILRPYLNIPGLGFVIIIAFVVVIGWVSSSFLMSSFINFFDHWLEKTPGIKFIYSSIKDFFEAFAGDKRKFNQSVLINVFADDVWVVGFVTDQELQKFEMGSDKIAVYVPQAYNFAGQLYILPRSRVKPVENITSGQSMKYAITGGVVDLEEDKTEEKK